MKIGACISPQLLFEPAIADYAEIPARTLFTMEQEHFDILRANVKDGRINPYAANRLTPNEMRLTGPDVDMDAIRNFCAKVFDRLAQLQVELVVFGAGRSKNVPDGFSRDKAWEQLFEIGALFADCAAQYGQRIAVEPLSYTETNIINTLEDAVFYTNTVNRDNFQYMVDFYHFYNNGQPDSSLLDCGSGLIHAHIAVPKTRAVPRTEEDWAFVRHCLKLLRAANYKGNLSFEGKYDDLGELCQMLAGLRKEVEL